MAEKANPNRLRFFEVYADETAYRAHVESLHFKKYVTADAGNDQVPDTDRDWSHSAQRETEVRGNTMKAKVLLQVMASVVIGALARHKTTRSRAFIVEGTANSAMCRRRAQTRTTRGRALLLSLACAMAVNATAHGADSGTKPPTEPSSQETNTVKIRLTINAKAMTASLSDNATTRDFLSLLPTTLTLEDYAATEKITYLPRKLSTAGAPAGSDPSVGDIAYYAPWGNLAIFYRDFRYSKGLIRLGRIDSGIEALNMPGPLKVTIERIEK